MTTTWIIVNIALVAVVTVIVAAPAVLIPALLHRHTEAAARHTARADAQRARHRRPAEGQRSVEAA
jgi:hypothetical protein